MRVSSCLPHLAVFLPFFTSAISPQSAAVPPAPARSLGQIISGIQQHDANQLRELESYQATRHYEVEYKGYRTSLSGGMVVEVRFDQSSGKTFRIVSQNGSKLLCDKVLRKAVESEQEAAKDKNSTALSPANYNFQLIGTDVLNGRLTYVLQVDPLHPEKFLYRGKVWVDATEFAVARIAVEPAKNPSIWISSSNIQNTYAATDGVWLPKTNRSESKIRVGGAAVLTIDYGTYNIVLAGPHAESAKPLVSPAITEAAFSAKR